MLLRSPPTQAVVSLVIAMKGNNGPYTKSFGSISDVRNCLQSLAADALTDEGDNVMAVEVLWTPSEPGVTISQKDLIIDYPELMQL